MEERIQQLEAQVADMSKFIQDLQAGHTLPLFFDQALQGRGFIKTGGSAVFSVSQGGTGASTLSGILKGNGSSAVTAVAPLSGSNTYYAAPSSGGSPTVGLNFTDGILVSVS